MLTIVLYRRRECASCDELREMLASLQEEIPHRLVEVDNDCRSIQNRHVLKSCIMEDIYLLKLF